MAQKAFSVRQIAQLLDAKFIGNGDDLIDSTASLDKAQKSDICFFNQTKYLDQLNTTSAGCVLLSAEVKHQSKANCVLVNDAYLAFAKVAQLLDSTPQPEAGIHPSVQIHASVQLGKNVAIAAGCVIEKNCIIGDQVSLAANVFVGQDSAIGARTKVYANVTFYHTVKIGEDCIFHAGAVIGSDGFGFANEKGRWVKIPQTGGLLIGNQVDIGANSCIDRGALNNTIIGDGVKIDNLCHIAHNVELGEHVAMAGFSAIAGSSKIGDYCTLSGRSSILGHLTIAPGTHITACSLINRSNKQAGVFSSGTGMQENKLWRKNVARFRQLDEMARKIKQLEKQLEKIQGDN